jgi:hypothetical protein
LVSRNHFDRVAVTSPNGYGLRAGTAGGLRAPRVGPRRGGARVASPTGCTRPRGPDMTATPEPPPRPPQADAPDLLLPRQPPPGESDDPTDAGLPDARVWAEVAAELAE